MDLVLLMAIRELADVSTNNSKEQKTSATSTSRRLVAQKMSYLKPKKLCNEKPLVSHETVKFV